MCSPFSPQAHLLEPMQSRQPPATPGPPGIPKARSGRKNREEFWLCLTAKTLYKFDKIDFSRPAWLGIKARQIFIESGPRWLDFWLPSMWPIDSTMNTFFVFSFSPRRPTSPHRPVGSDTLVPSPGSVVTKWWALFGAAAWWLEWQEMRTRWCLVAVCVSLVAPVIGKLSCLPIKGRVIKRKLGKLI